MFPSKSEYVVPKSIPGSRSERALNPKRSFVSPVRPVARARSKSQLSGWKFIARSVTFVPPPGSSSELPAESTRPRSFASMLLESERLTWFCASAPR
jgi:hypothetical protein